MDDRCCIYWALTDSLCFLTDFYSLLCWRNILHSFTTVFFFFHNLFRFVAFLVLMAYPKLLMLHFLLCKLPFLAPVYGSMIRSSTCTFHPFFHFTDYCACICGDSWMISKWDEIKFILQANIYSCTVLLRWTLGISFMYGCTFVNNSDRVLFCGTA